MVESLDGEAQLVCQALRGCALGSEVRQNIVIETLKFTSTAVQRPVQFFFKFVLASRKSFTLLLTRW